MAITSQSNLSSDTTQDVLDHQPQADSRETTFDPVIPAPAQPVYHPDPLEEVQRLKQQLGRLAQKYGLDEGADATAVLQEAEKRAGESSGKRSGGRIFTFASLRDVLASLKKPGRRGFAASVTPQSIPRESRSLTQVDRYNVGRYRSWAVLIGIDAYTQDPLRGCVSDVSLIKCFLTDDLGVPENRIQCLLGSKDPNIADPESTPSRANIVNTLYSLASNPEIGRGDNIIIYYAGHGSTYYCTNHDPESQCDYSCPIEALCPIDRDTQDADGNWIPDISDRELNILIGLICRAKGHKITFIVDAGYSGRMNRGQLPIGTFTKPEDMLHAADERWKDFLGYRSVLSKDWRPDMDSHVILAASLFMDELRGHGGYNGIFTEALLHVLRSTDWKEEMTYVDLIKLMRTLLPPEHTSLVSGKRMNERLWN